MAKSRLSQKFSYRPSKPNILSFFAYTLVLFFGATILANINPNANSEYRKDWLAKNEQEMQWVFITDDGQKYELDAKVDIEHASAEIFDYLMPNRVPILEIESSPLLSWGTISGDLFSGEFFSGALHEGQDEEQVSFSGKKENLTGSQDLNIELIDTTQVAFPVKKAYSVLRNRIEDRSIFINAVFEYLVRGEVVELPEGALRYVVALYGLERSLQEKVFEGQSCMTPWGYTIDDGESVLAYEQRADASFICNIQRRSCGNGKLSGTFVQSACHENNNGNIKEIWFETFNTSIPLWEELQGNIAEQESEKKYLSINGYYQPEEPTYTDAVFNLNGKRAQNSRPSTVGEYAHDTLRDEELKPLPNEWKKFCVSPWGEKVRAGQFVKAYRFKNGFTDIPCQVQLRLCVDGELEGVYEQPYCKPWETSFEDFRHWYLNGEEPSIQRLLKMLEKDYSTEDTVSELDDTTAMQMVQALEEEL